MMIGGGAMCDDRGGAMCDDRRAEMQCVMIGGPRCNV